MKDSSCGVLLTSLPWYIARSCRSVTSLSNAKSFATCKVLAPCRIACASYGGPIAITRDERQMVIVTGATMKPSITIYNAIGQKLCSVPWEQDSIVGLGWTGPEDLLVVTKTGEVIFLVIEL